MYKATALKNSLPIVEACDLDGDLLEARQSQNMVILFHSDSCNKYYRS